MSGEVTTIGEDEAPRYYTIDELAAASNIPSRTIRYYQSKGVLPHPGRRGRVAVYTDEHIERLRTITSLQDRGLRLDAIRDVFSTVEDGAPSLQQWLGLDDALTVPWLDEEPVRLTRAALEARVGSGRDDFVAQMVGAGLLVAPPDDTEDPYLVLSPGLFEISVRLDREQIDFSVQNGAIERIRTALRNISDELITFFADSAGEGFGNDPASMVRQLSALRPLAGDAVRIVFGQEMQRALELYVARGGVEEFAQRKGDGEVGGLDDDPGDPPLAAI